MKSTKRKDKDGFTIRTNWMLDDVVEAFEKRGINDGSNDDLIKELTIQKIEYGRTCIIDFLTKAGENRKTMNNYYKKMDAKLKEKIIKVGGRPIKILFFQ